ncbi:MAG: hypothetical protein RI991_1220, partial [Bacteroidota bacterium]
MKIVKLFIACFLLVLQSASAQEIKIDSAQKLNKNIVKINLIAFSINGQYERI